MSKWARRKLRLIGKLLRRCWGGNVKMSKWERRKLRLIGKLLRRCWRLVDGIPGPLRSRIGSALSILKTYDS